MTANQERKRREKKARRKASEAERKKAREEAPPLYVPPDVTVVLDWRERVRRKYEYIKVRRAALEARLERMKARKEARDGEA